MTHLYESLIKVLEDEYALCSSMSELLDREREVIVTLNYKELETLLQEKQRINDKIQHYDLERERIVTELGLKDKTITEISGLADAPYKTRLEDIAESFSRVVKKIGESNRLNSRLIERSLFHIRQSANFLGTFNVKPQQKISVEA